MLTPREGNSNADWANRVRELDRLVDGIAKGFGDPGLLGDRMKVASAERKEITTELTVQPAPLTVISLHPAMLARYEQQLAQLQDALAQGIRAGDSEAANAMYDLVETVTVFHDLSKPGGVVVEIAGRLTALLGEQAYPHGVKGVWGKMVAEEGFAFIQ